MAALSVINKIRTNSENLFNQKHRELLDVVKSHEKWLKDINGFVKNSDESENVFEISVMASPRFTPKSQPKKRVSTVVSKKPSPVREVVSQPLPEPEEIVRE